MTSLTIPPEVRGILVGRGFEITAPDGPSIPWWGSLESPIEKLWLASFFIEDEDLSANSCEWTDGVLLVHSEMYRNISLAIFPQWTVLETRRLGRADFCVVWFSDISKLYGALAVECDGHEWHERTKEQAKKDRSRDRSRLRNGVASVRFTGSEIHNSPESISGEIWCTCLALKDGLSNGMA